MTSSGDYGSKYIFKFFWTAFTMFLKIITSNCNKLWTYYHNTTNCFATTNISTSKAWSLLQREHFVCSSELPNYLWTKEKQHYLWMPPPFNIEHLNTGSNFTKRGSVPSGWSEEYTTFMVRGRGTSHLDQYIWCWHNKIPVTFEKTKPTQLMQEKWRDVWTGIR